MGALGERWQDELVKKGVCCWQRKRGLLWIGLLPLVVLAVLLCGHNITEERGGPLGAVQNWLGINQGNADGREDPVVIGHRGAGGGVEENSYGAIRKGLAAGVDWIEIDVRRCQDALVVFHDATIDRVFGMDGGLKVSELTLAELREKQGTEDEARLLRTLDEVLEKFKSAEKIKWLLDIKEPGMAEEVLAAVTRHGYRLDEQVIILGTSAIVTEYKGSGCGLCYAVGWSEGWNKLRILLGHSFVLDRCRKLGGELRAVALPDLFVRESLVSELQAQGVAEVWIYQVEDAKSWERCLRLGATGLIVDDVEGFKRFQAERAEKMTTEAK